MKKLLILGLLIIGATLTGCSNQDNVVQNETKVSETNTSASSAEEIQADKIEIVIFHGTVTCSSCTLMKENLQKTLNENFKDELDSGKIVYKEINGELRENREITMKYGASGLSVFINAINDGKDNIVEERNLWRYIQNEQRFKSYLTEKLNNL